jgi:hypothetical protein
VTYELITLFVLTGKVYVERDELTLQQCAGFAAVERTRLLEVPQLSELVGEVRYLCRPSNKGNDDEQRS